MEINFKVEKTDRFLVDRGFGLEFIFDRVISLSFELRLPILVDHMVPVEPLT